MNTIAIQFLAKIITANCLEQSEKTSISAARHLTMTIKSIFSSFSSHIHDLQWAEGSRRPLVFRGII